MEILFLMDKNINGNFLHCHVTSSPSPWDAPTISPAMAFVITSPCFSCFRPCSTKKKWWFLVGVFLWDHMKKNITHCKKMVILVGCFSMVICINTITTGWLKLVLITSVKTGKVQSHFKDHPPGPPYQGQLQLVLDMEPTEIWKEQNFKPFENIWVRQLELGVVPNLYREKRNPNHQPEKVGVLTKWIKENDSDFIGKWRKRPHTWIYSPRLA